MPYALISNIQRFSIHDGPGIRTTVFFQGCPLSCWWCHNPETIETGDSKVEIGDSKVETRREWGVEELMEELKKDRIFMEESGGGITFSGGEPMAQPDSLKELLVLARKNGIHTAVDTSGSIHPAIFKSFIPAADLWLFDLKLMDEQLHEKYTGQNNSFILENLIRLTKEHQNIWIRIPVIPGITDANNNLEKSMTYISGLTNIKKVELLPYHKMANHKYEQLNRENKLNHIDSMDNSVLNGLKENLISEFPNIPIS